MIPRRSRTRKRQSSGDGYKSGLERKVATQIEAAGLPVVYEKEKHPFVQNHTYTPDFLLPNGIYIECKGYFESADRTKHLLVQKQHPALDVRFLFSNSNTKLRKTSPTSYADWCRKHGFKFADKTVPVSWFKEKAAS